MRKTQFALLVLVVVSGPVRLQAQDPQPRHLSASIGVLQYQLSRSGLAPMIAVRGAVPVSSVLNFEGGIVASRPRHQLGGNATFLAPEAQFHLVLPFDRVAPYMGMGAGAVVNFGGSDSGGTQTDLSVSGSLGIRGWIGQRAGVQLEFRGRGIGFDFEQTSSEYTAGMIWRI